MKGFRPLTHQIIETAEGEATCLKLTSLVPSGLFLTFKGPQFQPLTNLNFYKMVNNRSARPKLNTGKHFKLENVLGPSLKFVFLPFS